ncbi:pentatricopeptide repeat-containing protein At4g04790, mitochondrial isoform X2 [Ricinus communis]|uniref:Pentatricopeptide repeat-containing protein, putative n=1 Tax=Ricinus communis TaxID=3988 RepID=B9SA19_RICCO|nr:pentatricopeptide repeat-containing protein At4g04790, mitochondrial isoform X2 [Ricinus communis]EEF39536.1 pentatricopeptide repeat-containing protein, putative [Ricinus communis]|eukprot:XP_002522838.1 pentatricopeptide repeat-containing protein At4g04790, mitochondrial isoform X1 [Ricinus communis]
MPRLKNLSSLFRSAAKVTPVTTTATTPKTKPANDTKFKQYVSSLDTSTFQFSSRSVNKPSKKSRKSSPLPPSDSRRAPPSLTVRPILPELILQESSSDSEDAAKELAEHISSILGDGSSAIAPDSQGTSSIKSLEIGFDIPWFQNLSHGNVNQQRKEVSRTRKQKWIFSSGQKTRFDQLIRMIDQKLGSEAILELFSKLGRETGVKEYNALIKILIEKARASDDKDVALKHIIVAFEFLKLMKEEGFRIDEETYSPFLMYLIDMGMVTEFGSFCEAIEENDSSSLARLGYYEMLLCIRVNNEEKIRELCSYIANNNLNETFDLLENYLLALCERDRKNELLQLLEIVDITKVSSLEHMVSIFNSLGRLLLESLAKKFLSTFKECDYDTENISTLIFSYATSVPNLAVEDAILKFKNLHVMLEMPPSSKSYEKLIIYSCDLLKVHAALDIVDQMCKADLTLSIDVLNSILRACEESFEFNLVQQIYSLICHHNLTPNNETFRSMIKLRVKMKDFCGAHDMLDDLKKFKLTPTASMYNAIMAGCFREKNINGGLMVLKKMELADVKPDSQTYSNLIANCNSENQISKYYEELKFVGIHVSKQIFMALINAYATCGQFEKAKQVLLDKGIPIENVIEIKSALVSALASHGQMSDALVVYEEIKEAGGNMEPKSVICLIEHYQSEGELSRLLKLLEELQDPNYCVDGCCRVMLWCIRNKHLSSAVNLLKQLKDRLSSDELTMQVIFDEVFSLIAEMEPTDLLIGLDLLQVIKDELCVCPSRKSLDFLLSACAKAKDLTNSLFIWKEYHAAGYPYNVISYLRMYQALLSSGDYRSAKVILAEIQKDDPHVRRMIQACQKTYIQSHSSSSTHQ